MRRQLLGVAINTTRTKSMTTKTKQTKHDVATVGAHTILRMGIVDAVKMLEKALNKKSMTSPTESSLKKTKAVLDGLAGIIAEIEGTKKRDVLNRI
jgi:hypothetical protein